MSRTHSQFPLRRRDLLKGGASLAAAAGLPGGLVGTAAAAANTLVIAAPATPQSLDCNFDVSLGTFEAIAVLYDNLLEFKRFPTRSGRALSAKTPPIIQICPPALPFRVSSRSRLNSTPVANSFASTCVKVSRAIGAMNLPPKT